MVMKGVALLAALLAGPGSGTLADEGVWRAYRGRIVVSAMPVAASGYDSEGAMMTTLRRVDVPALDERRGGFWRVHLVGFLREPPGVESLTLAFHEVTDAGPRARVYQADLDVKPTGRTVSIGDFVVSEELGFSAGRRYEIVMARTAAGRKDDVLARTTISLQ